MSSYATTVSETCTYTEVRARYVLGKVYDRLIALAMRGLLSIETAQRHIDDLLYLLAENATDRFEIQCLLPSGQSRGWRYEVDDTGGLVTDDPSGGMDAYSLPASTAIGLVVSLREDCGNRDAIFRELVRRGWGDNGRLHEGRGVREHTYSRGGYGLVCSRVGQWEEEA